MKIAPGTICEMVNYVGAAEKYNGKEVTVVGELRAYNDVVTGKMDEGYPLDFEENGVPIFAYRHNLRPIRFPGEDKKAFERFMKVVLSPVEIREEETV